MSFIHLLPIPIFHWIKWLEAKLQRVLVIPRLTLTDWAHSKHEHARVMTIDEVVEEPLSAALSREPEPEFSLKASTTIPASQSLPITDNAVPSSQFSFRSFHWAFDTFIEGNYSMNLNAACILSILTFISVILVLVKLRKFRKRQQYQQIYIPPTKLEPFSIMSPNGTVYHIQLVPDQGSPTTLQYVSQYEHLEPAYEMIVGDLHTDSSTPSNYKEIEALALPAEKEVAQEPSHSEDEDYKLKKSSEVYRAAEVLLVNEAVDNPQRKDEKSFCLPPEVSCIPEGNESSRTPSRSMSILSPAESLNHLSQNISPAEMEHGSIEASGSGNMPSFTISPSATSCITPTCSPTTMYSVQSEDVKDFDTASPLNASPSPPAPPPSPLLSTSPSPPILLSTPTEDVTDSAEITTAVSIPPEAAMTTVHVPETADVTINPPIPALEYPQESITQPGSSVLEEESQVFQPCPVRAHTQLGICEDSNSEELDREGSHEIKVTEGMEPIDESPALRSIPCDAPVTRPVQEAVAPRLPKRRYSHSRASSISAPVACSVISGFWDDAPMPPTKFSWKLGEVAPSAKNMPMLMAGGRG